MWNRIKEGLSKTSQRITQGLSSLFQSSSLTPEQWEEVEEGLIMADLGVPVAEALMTHIQSLGPMSEQDLKEKIVKYLASILRPYEKSLTPSPIILAVGVNGSGKTTILGKLGYKWHHQGYKVRLVAADTFRAGAVDQLAIWGRHLKVTSGGKDPASVVFKGLEQAQQEGDHIVLIDTAGRLPNKVDLMEELSKIYSVIQRLHPGKSCETVLVLDASLGQHALTQVEIFQKSLPLTGLIINKMDGTAKGGILVNITQTYHLPIYGLGMGEKPEDLYDFDALAFAQGLLGI